MGFVVFFLLLLQYGICSVRLNLTKKTIEIQDKSVIISFFISSSN